MKNIMILIILLVSLTSCETKKFKVEITYCDGRPKKIITIESCTEPDNNQIDTYKKAVPTWRGELNVCEIKAEEITNQNYYELR